MLQNAQTLVTDNIVRFIADTSVGIGIAAGTFGELLQGVLPSNRNFLVTLPINKYSYAKFYPNNITNELQVFPAHKKKAERLAKIILKYFNFPIQGVLHIESEIPEGKGMASSSADLVATAKSINNYYKLDISNSLLESFMSEIEPSDGVMYDGVVSYYQREAILRSHLGYLPHLKILAIDEGGIIDTIEFSKRRNEFLKLDKYQYLKMLKELEAAIRKQDVITIGKIATRSAIMNQKLKENKLLDEILNINQLVNGLGVVIAHSGTCIGILLDGNCSNLETQIAVGAHNLKKFADEALVYSVLCKTRHLI